MLKIRTEFSQENEHENEVHDLYDPNSTSKVVGKITLGYSAEVIYIHEILLVLVFSDEFCLPPFKLLFGEQ